MFKQLQKNFLLRTSFAKNELERLLLLSCLFSIGLTIFRILYTDQWRFAWLSWNLFLALVPYLITRFAIHRVSWIENRWKFALIFISWLLFVPNSFYIITDLFHLEISQRVPLWFDLALIFSFAWIAVMAGFIAGFDHDTKESIEEMADRLMEIGVDVPFLSIMTPFKGTPIHATFEKQGRILKDRDWRYYNGYNVAFQPANLSPEELLTAHRTLWKKAFSFSYSFRRIIRGVFRLRFGALCLSLFMNSFYCLKRLKGNYPIDMSKRSNQVEKRGTALVPAECQVLSQKAV